MRSRSMAKRFIPSSPPASFRIQMPLSKPRGQCGKPIPINRASVSKSGIAERLKAGSPPPLFDLIEREVSKKPPSCRSVARHRASVLRRVMGAWWPSPSSKRLSARCTSRGVFDSHPLRHFKFSLRSTPRGGDLRGPLSAHRPSGGASFTAAVSASLGGSGKGCRPVVGADPGIACRGAR